MSRRKSKKAGKENTQRRRSPRLAQKRSSPSPTATSPPRETPASAPDLPVHTEPPSDECLWFGTGPVKEYKRWGPFEPSWAVDYDKIKEVAGEFGLPWQEIGPGTWSKMEDDELKTQLNRFMRSWSCSYAVSKESLESVEGSLSADQKQAIMEELGDHCITKEWSTLVEYLPNGIHKVLPTILVEALLCKAVFEATFANPFFFIDTMDNKTPKVDKIPTPLGTELCKIWKSIRKINIVDAEQWRTKTIRLFHDTRRKRCYNESVVLRSIQHRKSVAQSLAEYTLSETHPVHPLLRSLNDPDEIKARLDALVELIDQVALLAVWAGTEESGLLLTPINRLPPHDDEGPLSVSHWCNQVAEDEVCLTGRYPVLMTIPLIHQLAMSPEDGITEFMVCPAEVVLSKPLRPDEIVGFQDDSCENWDIPRSPSISEITTHRARVFEKPPSNITFPPKD